jgi:hypothetical protein
VNVHARRPTDVTTVRQFFRVLCDQAKNPFRDIDTRHPIICGMAFCKGGSSIRSPVKLALASRRSRYCQPPERR